MELCHTAVLTMGLLPKTNQRYQLDVNTFLVLVVSSLKRLPCACILIKQTSRFQYLSTQGGKATVWPVFNTQTCVSTVAYMWKKKNVRDAPL